MSMSRLHNLNENEKIHRIQESLAHLNLVQAEREYYNKTVKEFANNIENLGLVLGYRFPCTVKISMHYSFDFAQQVHLPYSSQQVGPLYFLTGYISYIHKAKLMHL